MMRTAEDTRLSAGATGAGGADTETDTGADKTRKIAAIGLLGLVSLVIIGLVLLDSGIRGAGLFVTGAGLGALFFGFQYGFASGWRRFLETGDTSAIATHFFLIFLCSLLFLTASLFGISASGAFAPVSVSLVIGAFIFGIGMQLANGCGSGVLFSFGGGSSRMLVALPFFIIGSVIGSLWLPDALSWGSVNPVIIGGQGSDSTRIGFNLLLIGGVAGILFYTSYRRGVRLPVRLLTGSVFIAILCGVTFILAGHPWGVTFGFTLWGAKLVQAAGFDIASTEFWSWAGPARALSHSVLADISSLMNFGMLLGASGLAIFSARFGRYDVPPASQLLAAAVGGVLMGLGARFAFGCNIGAFVGGIASGSLHGWVWFALALAGSWVGVKLRPYFGFESQRRASS